MGAVTVSAIKADVGGYVGHGDALAADRRGRAHWVERT